MADVTSQGVLGAVARKNVSTEAEYGNDSFSSSGYYTVGRIQAWKLSVTNGTYTVSDITGRIFKTDNSTREFCFALADHDSGNDRPNIIRVSTNRRSGSNATAANVTVSVSGSITITDGVMWLICGLEAGPGSSRHYYNAGTGERVLEVQATSSNVLSGLQVDDAWSALSNVSTPTVHTDRKSLLKFTATLS